MPTVILNVINFAVSPFPDVVRQGMEDGFRTLIRSGVLRIDFTGSSTTSLYELQFVGTYAWTAVNRDRCWYRPGILGVTGNVNVEALRRRNYCQDVRDSRTCEAVFRETPQELGRAIVNTAVHEAAHLMGLDSGGADGSAHTGDAGNFMFINSLHAGYKPLLQDQQRTKRLTIQRGDSLSGIADRIGMHSLGGWRALYEFRGRDGRANRELLRSHNPNLIYPGEEIWIPDVQARLVYMRAVEVQPKSFTAAQLATMEAFVASGRSVFTVGGH